MNVYLNDYAVNDPANQVYLNDEIDGLGLPGIRTSSGNYAGRDGGYIGAQFYAARVITLTGTVFANDVATLESTRNALQTALDSASVDLEIVTNAGASYILFCNLLDFQMPILSSIFRAPFKIELLATDPTIYDNAAGTALTAALAKVVSGGYTYPVVYPVIYAAGSAATTVTNAGTVPVSPTITLTGKMTNPVLTNQTTNEFIGLHFTSSPSDTIAIDMLNRTILLNGGSRIDLMTSGSTWWTLEPGGNGIALTSSDAADTVSGVISWRSGFKGI